MTINQSQIKLTTAMRDAFVEADSSLESLNSGVIFRQQMWNRKSDNSPRALNRDYCEPRKKFNKPIKNRSQMYEFSRH